VLVVSGRLRQRTIMQETLRSLGIECEVATRETAAATVAKARQAGLVFDTVIADVEDGPQAVGELIAEASAPGQRQPRAVLVVDQAGGGRLEAFKSAGCNAYLVRPVRPTSLVTQLGLQHGHGEAPLTAADAHRAATGPNPVSVTRGRRILLVEDNDINALLARRMSEKAGCIVHHAPSGPDALDWCGDILAKSDTVDLVLMDIHMPEMDGFETARRVRRLFAARDRVAPPIVALTANAFAEDRKRCLEAGLDDYLAKPFDRSELEALLRKWCATEQSPRDGSIDGCAA
jgi:CheY-like chemotaxis protein